MELLREGELLAAVVLELGVQLGGEAVVVRLAIGAEDGGIAPAVQAFEKQERGARTQALQKSGGSVKNYFPRATPRLKCVRERLIAGGCECERQ